MSFKLTKFSLALTLLFSLSGFSQTNYLQEVNAWRDKREAGLKKDDSWLTLAGLFWLKEGANTLGAAEDNTFVIKGSAAPAHIGRVDFKAGEATFTAANGVKAEVNGAPVQIVKLKVDDPGPPTMVHIGNLSFTFIKRDEAYAIRLRDIDSPVRRSFKGLSWYPVKDEYRVVAHLVPFSTPKEVAVPNVLGGAYKMQSPGLLEFTLRGVKYTLQPVIEDDNLFIIFRDATSNKTTYGAGRFIDADMPVNGEVILDFNKAYNPPCAFTAFATCPLPPSQNRLKVAIEAGEKITEQNRKEASAEAPRN
jgi:uncharacterized protein (DUF1684 family)